MRINRGLLKDYRGEVSVVYSGNNRIEVMTNIRGQQTPVELDPSEIDPLTPDP